MKYNFDEIIDRQGTGTVKYEALNDYFGRDGLLPLWVADMDFATPPFIIEALRKRLEHPVLGYTVTPDAYWLAIVNWVEARHQWSVQREWICYIPGIVKGIGFVLNCFTKPGDKVIIQPPVYHPFRLVPERNGRQVVYNPLIRHNDNSYEMDFEGLEALTRSGDCKVLILANPHNPVGICWSKETLQRLAHLCYERGILVISDEIHCDMALFGHHHLPFGSVSDEAAHCSITFQAPTKTFNIAGVVSSYAIIPDDEIRRKFFSWMESSEFEAPNIFAPIATIAAFTEGEEWREQMVAYVEDNVRLVEDFCQEHLPQIHPVRPQASFLVWLDCRGLKLSHEDLISLFVDKARLALNDGEMFNPGGEGYMRLNVGTPRAVLHQALLQLSEGLSKMSL